jgi:DMSO/TMAO reductase YedYZ molybdopterin-dependent catalytic subunit
MEQPIGHHQNAGGVPHRSGTRSIPQILETLAAARSKVGGLVERPVELSLSELAAMGKAEHITMHHCIQGWSGIAEWGGLSMKALVGW